MRRRWRASKSRVRVPAAFSLGQCPALRWMEAEWIVISVHEIALGQGQDLCWGASEKSAIGAHFVGFRVHFHTGRRAIQQHGTLSDFARVADRKKLLCKLKLPALLHQGLADECD